MGSVLKLKVCFCSLGNCVDLVIMVCIRLVMWGWDSSFVYVVFRMISLEWKLLVGGFMGVVLDGFFVLSMVVLKSFVFVGNCLNSVVFEMLVFFVMWVSDVWLQLILRNRLVVVVRIVLWFCVVMWQ